MSLTFVPFRVLSSLFCTIWIVLKSAHSGSFPETLTLPYSCKPYLILDVNSPSTIFKIDLCETWFFSLLMMYSRLFKEEITPPFPSICSFHCWLSSHVIPSSLAVDSLLTHSFPILIPDTCSTCLQFSSMKAVFFKNISAKYKLTNLFKFYIKFCLQFAVP